MLNVDCGIINTCKGMAWERVLHKYFLMMTSTIYHKHVHILLLNNICWPQNPS